MPNVDLLPRHPLSTFRRVALGSWRDPYDPTVYGSMSLPADSALAYLERYRAATGKHVTLTHLAGKALALALREVPEANALLRWGRPRLRRDVNLCFQVLLESAAGADLTMVTVRRADQLELGQLADACNAKVERARSGRDHELSLARQRFRHVPRWLLPYLLRLTAFLTYTLNWNLSWAGIPKDAFGSALLSNIGTLGLDDAYVPLLAYSRVPLQLALGAVHEAPVVEHGRVVVRRRIKLNASFDHRLLDGWHAKRLSEIMRRCFERPWEMLGPIPQGPEQRADISRHAPPRQLPRSQHLS